MQHDGRSKRAPVSQVIPRLLFADYFLIVRLNSVWRTRRQCNRRQRRVLLSAIIIHRECGGNFRNYEL